MTGKNSQPELQAEPPKGGVLHSLALRRSQKEQAEKAVPSAQLQPLTPRRAVSTALGRAAQNACGLPIFPTDISIGAASLAEIGELLPSRALLLIVETVGDHLGVVALCPSLAAALIEVQALGRVSSAMPAERRMTRTDAALSADFVNAVLAELTAELGELEGFPMVRLYRYASFVDDPRPLELMLAEGGYLNITASMRLGKGGAREGILQVYLPQALDPALAPPPPKPDEGEQPDEATPQAAEKTIKKNLAAAVQGIPLEIQAELCRMRLPLAKIETLKPGSTIALPFGVLDMATLVAPDGQVLARGRLGEADGQRAIKLSSFSGHSKSSSAIRKARDMEERPMAAATDIEPWSAADQPAGLDHGSIGMAAGFDAPSNEISGLDDLGSSSTDGNENSFADFGGDFSFDELSETGEDAAAEPSFFALDEGAEPPLGDLDQPDPFRLSDDSEANDEADDTGGGLPALPDIKIG